MGKHHAKRGLIPAWGTRPAAGVAFVLALVLTGCATTHDLMPTPVIYRGPDARPLFDTVPVDDKPPSLDLLFVTDRAAARQADGLRYTAGRSRSVAFGSATIQFGEGLDWKRLIEESTTRHADGVQLKLGSVTELGRFPPIPYEVA